jgi:arginase family enzyme
MNFFGICSDFGALGKNNGCASAPEYLMKLFGVEGTSFSPNSKDVDEAQKEIFAFASRIDFSKKSFIFGGTHDITFSLVKAFAEKNKNPSLLIFDAHADCEDSIGSVTHEDFVRFIVEEKILLPKNIFIVGLRDVSSIEKQFLSENKIAHTYFSKITFEETLSLVKNFVSKSKELYISFDADVLDSKIMQATGYAPKGGFSLGEAKNLLNECFSKALAFDLVEFNPQKIKLGENKLLKELFDFVK